MKRRLLSLALCLVFAVGLMTTAYAGSASSYGTVTIYFDTQGGSSVDPITVSAGSSVDLTRYKPTKDGYAFNGWYTSENNPSKTTDSITLMSGTQTVYASWVEGYSLTVITTCSNTECTTEKQETVFAYSKGATVDLSKLEIAAWTGHTSNGSFYTDADMTGIIKNTTLTLNEDTVVYAGYMHGSDSTISGSAGESLGGGVTTVGGGSSDSSDNSGSSDSSDSSSETCIIQFFNTAGVKVHDDVIVTNPTSVMFMNRSYTPDAQYIPEGYEFGNWYYNKELSGTPVPMSYTVTTDLTLYAKFTKTDSTSSDNTGGSLSGGAGYTLTYDPNGGELDESERTVSYDGVNTVDFSNAPTPTREGYTFTGWYKDADATNKLDSMLIYSDTTVYAGWEENTTGGGNDLAGGSAYTLTFDPNGGELAESERTATYVGVCFIDFTDKDKIPTPTREGYTFVGWCKDKEGTTTLGTSEPIFEATTVYAKWEKNVETDSTTTIGGGSGSDTNTTIGGGTNTGATIGGGSSGGSTGGSAGGSAGGSSGGSTGGSAGGSAGGSSGSTSPSASTTDNDDAKDNDAEEEEPAGDDEEEEEPTETVDVVAEYDDIKEGYWGTEAISFVVSKGLFNGTSTTTFSPDDTMTRQMLMTVLARLDGADTTSDPYGKGMAWALENNITDGSDPTGSITREQLAVMLWRYAGSPTATQTALDFTDAGEVSSWAQQAMLWANENGIISGKGGGILDPKGEATRTQVAKMIMVYCSIEK